MTKRNRLSQAEGQASFARLVAARFLFVVSITFLATSGAQAIPLSEYHQHIRQAVTALDTLAQSDETESAEAFDARDDETVQGVRNLLPATETVDWNSAKYNVDNSWLHQELDKYAADASAGRYDLLRRITERLKAVDERITELEKPAVPIGTSRADAARRLGEILQRSEYARRAKPQRAVDRVVEKILEWIRSWLPKPKPITPGNFSFISWIAQWLVIILALAVLAYAVTLLIPRLLRGRRSKKKTKAKARIVLGERLEPDQSALDLLSEAEALARRGELRAAIRRAYIALLVELGDRKIISLAQYKTNRDYVRAVRDVEPLYGNVKQLTDSFERHWYGLAQATETDWRTFRAAYEQALK